MPVIETQSRTLMGEGDPYDRQPETEVNYTGTGLECVFSHSASTKPEHSILYKIKTICSICSKHLEWRIYHMRSIT